jgi:D-alanyl-D-alanine carboxypeptidase-like protein
VVEKQCLFARMIAQFIPKAYEMGYLLNFGEAWRPEIVAQAYAKMGKGISNSLHCLRLAVDLNAYFEGKWLDGSQDWHIPHLERLGKLWESMGGSWGGRFTKKDYNHYSLQHNGVR